MSKDNTLNSVNNFRAVIQYLILLVVSGLTACTSSYTIKTFDGEASDGGVALLKVAQDLELVALDGEPVETYMLDGLSIDYQVLPGAHTAIVRYSGVWANPGAHRKDVEGRADRIKSHLLRIDFDAQAGAEYHFSYLKPDSRGEALATRDNFKVTLLDSNDNQIALSSVFDPSQSTKAEKKVVANVDKTVTGNLQEQGASFVGAIVGGVKNAVVKDKPESKMNFPKPTQPRSVAVASGENRISGQEAVSATQKAVPMDSNSGLPRLDALKLMWQQASKEEKKAFLRWAFQ